MTEQNIQQLLRRKDATIDEMKAEVDSKINELEQLKQKILHITEIQKQPIPSNKLSWE